MLAIFTKLFKKQQPNLLLTAEELKEDILSSLNRLRGLRSSLKHYSGMATDQSFLAAQRRHYAKLQKAVEHKLRNEELEYNTLLLLQSKLIVS